MFCAVYRIVIMLTVQQSADLEIPCGLAVFRFLDDWYGMVLFVIVCIFGASIRIAFIFFIVQKM